MSKFTVSAILSALALATAGTAFAEDAKKKAEPPAEKPAPATEPKAPTPPAELDAWKPMEGTWKCTGKTLASEMGPEHPVAATIKIKRDLDKMWLNVRVEHKKSKTDPMPWKGQEMITFDKASGKWTRAIMDNMGGWAMVTSPGWEGEKMVWTGDFNAMGRKMGFRQTFTKGKTPKELSFTIEMGDAKANKWAAMVEETCKK